MRCFCACRFNPPRTRKTICGCPPSSRVPRPWPYPRNWLAGFTRWRGPREREEADHPFSAPPNGVYRCGLILRGIIGVESASCYSHLCHAYDPTIAARPRSGTASPTLVCRCRRGALFRPTRGTMGCSGTHVAIVANLRQPLCGRKRSGPLPVSRQRHHRRWFL